MNRYALFAATAALALAAVQGTADAQSSTVRNPYIALQPGQMLGGQTGYTSSGSIRDPSAGTLAPQWLDSSSITDPKAGSVTPDGFAKYSSLSSAIQAEPVIIGPSGPLNYTLPPQSAPVPTYYNSYGTPFTPYTAPTNAFSTPYTVYTDPYLVRPAPAGYGSSRVPSTVDPATQAAADVASGDYLPRPMTGNSRRGSNR
jgi:hypothetical protein